jgi:predicted dehydrogenase
MDVGCYCLSALRLLFGEPERVSCETVDRGGVDARASAVLRFAGGRLGSLQCAFDSVAIGTLEVVGSAGRLLVEDPWKHPVITRGHADGRHEVVEMELRDPYRLEVEDLSRAIRDGGEPLLGRADALGQARALEALYASAASHA